MAHQSTHEKLVQLHEIILKERECAKALDMNEMAVVNQRKEELLKSMGRMNDLEPEDRLFAEKIQTENRRNAYLFWSTLNWIRETMTFFGKQTAPVAYTPYGYAQTRNGGGKLLSGRV